jgi:hypothetical protein
MESDHSYGTRLKRILASLAVVLALLPLTLLGLLRSGAMVPTGRSIRVGPLRIVTTCWSQKRFCLPLENAKLPPHDIFILLDWPGDYRHEEVLMVIPIR